MNACCLLLLAAEPALALPSVTILGDPAIAPALAEIARNYARDRGTITSTVFTPESEQEKEITEGGSADVLITPRTSWIEKLKTQGLLDVYSQVPIARSRLALAAGAQSSLQSGVQFPLSAIIAAMNGEQLFLMPNAETLPEGAFAREALQKLGVEAELEEYTLFVKSRPDMLGMLRDSGAYGVMLYASVFNTPGIRIIESLPETSHRPIEFYAVVLAGNNMDEARKFLDYLKTRPARSVLRENGFIAD